MLSTFMTPGDVEAGVDEAGRGALAGPVVAAAVVWNPELTGDACPTVRRIRDSKRLSRAQREALRGFIQDEAVAWSVCAVDPSDIDRLNILVATMKAMRGALDGLDVDVDRILVDGPHFHGYVSPSASARLVPFTCIEGGDDKYVSIAAASILAKTHRDQHVVRVLAPMHPEYGWESNVGYGSAHHMEALRRLGPTQHHRASYAPVRAAAAAAAAQTVSTNLPLGLKSEMERTKARSPLLVAGAGGEDATAAPAAGMSGRGPNDTPGTTGWSS